MNPAYFFLAPMVAAGVTALAAAQCPAPFESQAETPQDPIVPESQVAGTDDADVWTLRA